MDNVTVSDWQMRKLKHEVKDSMVKGFGSSESKGPSNLGCIDTKGHKGHLRKTPDVAQHSNGLFLQAEIARTKAELDFLRLRDSAQESNYVKLMWYNVV